MYSWKCCIVLRFFLALNSTSHIVFIIDASSDIKWDDMENFKKLVDNIVTTFKISKDHVKYSLVSYGADVNYLVPFMKSLKDDFDLSNVKLQKQGGPRDVYKALRFVNEEVFNTKSGFNEKVTNGMIIVFTTGKFVESTGAETSIAGLLERNMDIVFVDTAGGVLDEPFRTTSTNVSIQNTRNIPTLLPRLSSLIGRLTGE